MQLIAEAMDFRDWCENECVRLIGTKGILLLLSGFSLNSFSSTSSDGSVGNRIRILNIIMILKFQYVFPGYNGLEVFV